MENTRLQADVVMEGGGVFGLGLVGALTILEKHHYQFRRVAGTSAGAIVASLLAAGMSAQEIQTAIASVPFTSFEDPTFLSKFGPLGEGLSILQNQGIYQGDVLRETIAKYLAIKGVRTFADLRITDDPDSSLPSNHQYKLVVMTSDLSRGELVRLPWDYHKYGLNPDTQLVADAVRASASVPFFFTPVKLDNNKTHHRSYLVDGGLLSNFPIDTFDRTDGKTPRWPTFGIKLSARPKANQIPHKIHNTFDLLKAMLSTMQNAHDQMHLDEACVVKRTIFVDTTAMRLDPLTFNLSTRQANELFSKGQQAADAFLAEWDFQKYKRECRK